MEHEAAIRLAAFVGLFVAFTLAETLWPRRARSQTRRQRWPTNIAIVVVDQIAARALALALPLLAVGAALDSEAHGWGFFNMVSLPGWAAALIAILILDFAIWLQHLVFHRVPALWRLHRVHHADRDFDVTTALRFHPVEILLSMLIKIAVVYLIGAPALAVILFEVILNGTAMFNHSNMRLPARLDRAIRRVLVTPDMHRVHHSTRPGEHNANYGFALSIWDRVFRTYVAQPAGGHDAMTIGLEMWQDDRPAQLGWALTMPFGKS